MQSLVRGQGHGTGGTEQRGVEMVGRPLPAFMGAATLPEHREDVAEDIRDDEENSQELQLEVDYQPVSPIGAASIEMRDEIGLEGDPAPLLQDLPATPQSRIRQNTTIDLTRSPDTSAPSHSQNMISPGCSPVPPSSTSVSSIQCPVCMESLTSLRSKGYHLLSTICGHIFCSNCLPECVRLHSQCPTCRQRLTSREYHELFLN